LINYCKEPEINFYKNALLLLIALTLLSALMILAPEYAHYALLLLSALLIARGIKSLLPYYQSKKWLKCKATIHRIEETFETVKVSQYSETEYYFPLVEYSYEFNSQSHSNDCVTFEKQNIWTSGHNAWGDILPETEKPWHSWTVGSYIDVYINPEKPHMSVLIATLSTSRKSHHFAVILSGVILLIIWIAVLTIK
jgi:hypothetical protein